MIGANAKTDCGNISKNRGVGHAAKRRLARVSHSVPILPTHPHPSLIR
jgi:hypothetical protein